MMLTLYHGTEGDNVLSIISSGTMRPDASQQICFSEQFSDALQHGADTKRKECYALKLQVTLPVGASQTKEFRHGNERAVIVRSPMPVPVQVLEMYVRVLSPTTLTTIKGVAAIKAYLQKK